MTHTPKPRWWGPHSKGEGVRRVSTVVIPRRICLEIVRPPGDLDDLAGVLSTLGQPSERVHDPSDETTNITVPVATRTVPS